MIQKWLLFLRGLWRMQPRPRPFSPQTQTQPERKLELEAQPQSGPEPHAVEAPLSPQEPAQQTQLPGRAPTRRPSASRTRQRLFEATVEELIDFMSTATHRGRKFADSVPITYFNDAHPLAIQELRADHEQQPFIPVLTPSDVGSWDVAYIGTVLDDDRGGSIEWREGMSLYRVRSVSMKALRGLKLPVAKHFAEMSIGVVYRRPNKGALFESTKVFYAYVGRKWVLVSPAREGFPNGPLEHASDRITMAIGLYAYRKERWRVVLGLDGCPSIGFVTDPIGVKEVFRLRDVPEGARRRAALRHWVTSHWRQTRIDSRTAREVRAHLRGTTQFAWNGFTCRIIPSDTNRLLNQEEIAPVPVEEVTVCLRGQEATQ